MAMDESTAQMIRAQVEFYFSDSNLPTDKFLLDKVRLREAERDRLSVRYRLNRSLFLFSHVSFYSFIPDALPKYICMLWTRCKAAKMAVSI